MAGLGVALNEATWHDLGIEPGTATVSVLLAVLARDEDGAEVGDPRRTLVLTGVSRLAASYRAGPRDDADAAVLPLDADGLCEVLRRHGGTPVYGWDPVDGEDSWWPVWRRRLSLDLALDGPGGHHLTLFQDIRGRAHLDLRVWFADLAVRDGSGLPVEVDELVAAGVRWWDAMYAGERSDLAPGIAPAAPSAAVSGWTRWRDRFRRTTR